VYLTNDISGSTLDIHFSSIKIVVITLTKIRLWFFLIFFDQLPVLSRNLVGAM